MSATLACRSVTSLGERLTPSPSERYAESIREAGLAESLLGRRWLAAADEALATARSAPPPFQEVVYFDPAEPRAAAWRFDLRVGRELRVEVVPESGSGTLFVDLHRRRDDQWERVVGTTGAEPLVREIDDDGEYLVRLQPELLTGGRTTVTVTDDPTLTFPVDGAAAADIGSVFGDPRDGASRSHHGVDIFAPRGTLAVAATDAIVRRVGTNRLGGNVVWLSDLGRGVGFYYAHLEEQLVSAGDRVRAGEAIGRVGNSGNARGTPPHLHFGIFRDGAIDPAPWIVESSPPEPVSVPLERIGTWARIGSATVNLRQGASTATAVATTLPYGRAVFVHGAESEWLHVSVPGAGRGYVFAGLTEPLATPLAARELASAVEIRARPEDSALAITTIDAAAELSVLAHAPNFDLVDVDGRFGWVADETDDVEL